MQGSLRAGYNPSTPESLFPFAAQLRLRGWPRLRQFIQFNYKLAESEAQT